VLEPSATRTALVSVAGDQASYGLAAAHNVLPVGAHATQNKIKRSRTESASAASPLRPGLSWQAERCGSQILDKCVIRLMAAAFHNAPVPVRLAVLPSSRESQVHGSRGGVWSTQPDEVYRRDYVAGGAMVWMPHSVLASPLQRPPRTDVPAGGRVVQGMQPTEAKPRACSGWRGRLVLSKIALSSADVRRASGLNFSRGPSVSTTASAARSPP
jgi:hypothetical protein